MPKSSFIRTAMRRSCCMKPRLWRPSIDLSWSSPRSKRSSSRPWEARPMRNILLIAKREYLEQIRGRAFRMSTIAVPALFAIIIGIMYLSGRGAGGSKHIVVASSDLVLADGVRSRLLEDKEAMPNVELLAPAKTEDRAALIDRVKSKAIDGFLWIDIAPGKDPSAVYISQSAGDFITDGKLGSALNHAVVRERMATTGIKPSEVDALLKNIEIETSQMNKEGKEVKSNALTSIYKGYIMALLLSMTTMIYGLNVARSIIQEKTSRIFE